MALSEFDLIDRYFKTPAMLNGSTRLGIGDDCALLSPPAGYELALTTDTMVEQVHFLAGTDPEALGHKLLAVNLSDLASMGAEPAAVMLALTLPTVDPDWLQAFARGFLTLARQYGVDLIGGDTTRGPLTLSVQALGWVPVNQAMRRSAARVGDIVGVTGPLGDAGLGLKVAQGEYTGSPVDSALARFYRPEPQVAVGLALRAHAHACIDISDGLLADLGHIVKQSQVGAELIWEQLPLSAAVNAYIASSGDWQLPLIAGDDYELCFTVSPENVAKLACDFTPIGKVVAGNEVVLYKAGQKQRLHRRGYEHFS